MDIVLHTSLDFYKLTDEGNVTCQMAKNCTSPAQKVLAKNHCNSYHLSLPASKYQEH